MGHLSYRPMTSPHLLRPFSARQLSLVSGGDRVMAFAILGGNFRGPSAQVHAPTLVRRTRDLPSDTEVVVFFDVPVPDAAMVSTIDDMISVLEETELEVLAVPVPATEAVKRVGGGLVAEGIDRSALVSLRCPVAIRRNALESVVAAVGQEPWVDICQLAAAHGSRIGFYDPGIRVATH